MNLRVKLTDDPNLPNNGRCCDEPDLFTAEVHHEIQNESYLGEYYGGGQRYTATMSLRCRRCHAEIEAVVDDVSSTAFQTESYYDNETDELVAPEFTATARTITHQPLEHRAR